jgi:hypothetical protein
MSKTIDDIISLPCFGNGGKDFISRLGPGESPARPVPTPDKALDSLDQLLYRFPVFLPYPFVRQGGDPQSMMMGEEGVKTTGA